MKQTAVEFLIYHIRQDTFVHSKSTKEWNEVFQQAKEMEKEMIIETSKNSYIAGYLDNQAKVDDSSNFPEDYYNETFKQQEQ
jgi:hypothetical protein